MTKTKKATRRALTGAAATRRSRETGDFGTALNALRDKADPLTLDLGTGNLLDKMYDNGWPNVWTRSLRNEIVPGLWVGGLLAAERAEPQDFDLIVNLSGVAVREQFGMENVPHVWWAIDDGARMPDAARLVSIAAMIASTIRRQATVLVHCAAGINRSALTAAVAVMLLKDCSGAVAMRTVQAARRGSLANPTFAQWLRLQPRPTDR